MTKFTRQAVASVLTVAGAFASVLACGTSTEPPPPPPQPPIVCCQVVAWWIDPLDPTRQYAIIRYYRIDGLPLFQSNPMPLAANQLCACSLGKLPNIPGVEDAGLSFGVPQPNPCQPFPDSVPGYGPWGRAESCSNPPQQIESFFDIFTQVAGIPPSSGTQSVAYTFGGPGNIPPGVTFDVYRKICFPRGVDISQVACPPGSLTAIGLFLVNNGTALVEPVSPGQPPIPFSLFQQNPGASSFYKVLCCPPLVTAPCDPCFAPAPCPGDANGDNVVNFSDITTVLANFGFVCLP
jgi:hypothetical protein